MSEETVIPRTAPREPERLVFFSDAVVAIAMTLLVLPLMESVQEASELSTQEYLSEHSGQLVAFLTSFVLVASNWLRHHSLFQHVRAYVRPMALVNMLWLLTIVWLPVATAMTGGMQVDRLQITLYIGTLALASALQFLLARTVLQHPEITRPAPGSVTGEVAASAAMTILFLAALVVALVVSAINYLALFVLCLTPVLARRLRSVFASAPS